LTSGSVGLFDGVVIADAPAAFGAGQLSALYSYESSFGVRQVELYHNHDGQVYCLLEAPDAEAVRQHHAALGVPCGDVHEVNSLT